MVLFKKNLNQIFFFLLVFLILTFVLNSDIIFIINSLGQNLELEKKSFFEDWKFIFSTIECKNLGYDITLKNPCDDLGRFWWGDNIQFYIPYNNNFDLFYLSWLPWFQIVIFFYILFKIFDSQKNIIKLLIVFIIFSPQTLLLFARMNNDLLIFILIFFIVLRNSNLLSTAIVSFISLAKFYPIITSIIFFLNNDNIKKNLLYLFLSFILILSFFLFSFDYANAEKLYDIRGQLYGKSFRNFSFIAPLKYYSLTFSDSEIYKKIEIIIFLIIFFLILSFTSLWFALKFKKYSFDYQNFNFRLFVIGANIFVITYLIFQNTFYREIFLVLVIPFVYEYSKETLFHKFLFNLIFIKYFLGFALSILIYFVGIIHFLFLFKMIFDFFVVSILLGLLFNINYIILRRKLFS